MALKSKVHVAQNWPNLEKRPPFLQFSSKLSDFFLVKDLTNYLLVPLIASFWKHTFLLGCDVWKMDALFLRPLGPISIILNFPKKYLVKADIKQLSPKKFEKFWWKLKEYKPYPCHPEQVVQMLGPRVLTTLNADTCVSYLIIS